MLNRKYKQRITWTCLLINFLSCWISVSFLEPRQLTSDVWASIRREWLRSWTAVFDKTTSLILKCTSAPTVAYPPSQVRTCEVGINHNIVDLNTRYAINLEEGQFLYQKAQKKFWAAGDNQTDNPLSSSLDAPTTELLEALWWAGSKFNYNYTSHRGLHQGLPWNPLSTSVQWKLRWHDCKELKRWWLC